MSKKITFEYDGKPYTLEFTKRTVRQMEQNGFIASKIDDMPRTMIPMLFNGAFLANHPFMKDSLKEEIYEAMENKADLISVLGEMYNEPIEALVAEPEEGAKNVKWTES